MIQLLASPFGPITAPPGVEKYAGSGGEAPGLITFLSNIVKLLIIIGGIYALINIVLAGYGFLSAGDDPKKIQAATGKIWQSLIGLLIMAGSFLLAALFGWILFQDPRFILWPQIQGP